MHIEKIMEKYLDEAKYFGSYDKDRGPWRYGFSISMKVDPAINPKEIAKMIEKMLKPMERSKNPKFYDLDVEYMEGDQL